MKSISFIGGDNRSLILSNVLEDRYKNTKLCRYGLGSSKNTLEECINCDCIIFPIPFSKDGENLYSPLNDRQISIGKCIQNVENKTIFVGNIDNKINGILEKNKNFVVDIAKDAEFIKNNTIPTAEGIIQCIISNTDITIDKSNILIIGFGNVGKKAAELLNNLNSKVYCYDINKQEVANIETKGYNVLNNLDNYMKKMDVIVNTVPTLVIDKDKFKFINKNTLIIDVASKPGGIDFVYAKENNYRVIQYLGIPGKIAPRTSAKYMMNIITKYII